VTTTDDKQEIGAHAVSIIIPAYNEEGGLEATLDEIRQAFAERPEEIDLLVVDDGSTDRTAEVARAHGVRVVSHPARSGYGAALKTGFRAVTSEHVAIIDADGTYPAHELPRLFDGLADFDMVVGQRTGPHYRRMALLSPMRSFFLLLCGYVVGSAIPDPNSGLRVFRRSVVMPYLDSLPRAFSFTTTITLILMLNGNFIDFQRIDYRRRIGKRKVRLFRDALRVLQTLTEVILDYNPLKLFGLLAFVPVALGLASFFVMDASDSAWMSAFGGLGLSAAILAIGFQAYVAQRNRPRGGR
jgi:polyisoprenyl-phosphate glycosyltransferase